MKCLKCESVIIKKGESTMVKGLTYCLCSRCGNVMLLQNGKLTNTPEDDSPATKLMVEDAAKALNLPTSIVSLDGKIPVRKNTHPTVKPTSLMQYLVRLVTPNNGTILDPFNGSGSTGKAVMYENKKRNKNYKYIGIELTEEYLPIAKARIEYIFNIEETKNNEPTIFDYL